MTEERTEQAKWAEIHYRALTPEEIAVQYERVLLSWEALDGSTEWWPYDLPLYRKRNEEGAAGGAAEEGVTGR